MWVDEYPRTKPPTFGMKGADTMMSQELFEAYYPQLDKFYSGSDFNTQQRNSIYNIVRILEIFRVL